MRVVTTHSFDVSLAEECGIDAALIIGHFNYFIEHHRANDTNFFNGHYWTYDTAESLAQKFPYWSKNKIQKLLVKMEEQGLIVSGDFSENRFKRPKYYRVLRGQEACTIKPNGLLGESHLADSSLSDQSTNQSTDQLSSKKKFSDDDLRLAEWILKKVKEVAPKSKANIEKWADTIRLMREKDKLTHNEIQDVFAWANRDSFWKTNVLSVQKLREKFAVLHAKVKNGTGGNSGHDPRTMGSNFRHPGGAWK
ncbi:hypothetical protein ACPV5U_08685 [Vibrio mediterranei]